MCKVGICSGHQRSFPGAEYYDLIEHKVCRDIVYAAKNALIDYGLRVVEPIGAYDEEMDSADIHHKVRVFNEHELDCAVEVHLDALPQDESVKGFHVIHYMGSEGGLRLARCIGAGMSASGFRQTMNPHTMDIPILRNPKAWAVLVECGFLTHEETAKKLKNLSYREKIGNAIADGIMQFGG